MILLVLLQLFTAEIDSAVSAYNNSQDEKAYKIAFSIPIDSIQDDFEYYEVLELRGLLSKRLRKFDQAAEIYKEVIQCNYDSILYKAYLNFADVYYYTFDFDKRIEYLQKAYHIDPAPKVIRNIARHHFQIRADYETAQIWIDRHPTNLEPKDQAGFSLLLAEFNESKRQYDQAIDYYTKAKISAQKANLFNYELFAAEGEYRTKRLLDVEEEEKMINYIVWLILSVGIYYYVKKKKFSYAGINQPQD